MLPGGSWGGGGITRFEAVDSLDGSGFNIQFYSIKDIQAGVRVPQGSGVVGDDVWDSVFSHGPFDDPAELGLGRLGGDLSHDESSLDVDQHSIIFLDFRDAENIWRISYGSGGLPMRPSGNLGSFLTLLSTRMLPALLSFANLSLQIILASWPFMANLRWCLDVTGAGSAYLRTMEIGIDCLSLWGPWQGLVAYWIRLFLGESYVDAAELGEHPGLGGC